MPPSRRCRRRQATSCVLQTCLRMKKCLLHHDEGKNTTMETSNCCKEQISQHCERILISKLHTLVPSVPERQRTNFPWTVSQDSNSVNPQKAKKRFMSLNTEYRVFNSIQADEFKTASRPINKYYLFCQRPWTVDIICFLTIEIQLLFSQFCLPRLHIEYIIYNIMVIIKKGNCTNGAFLLNMQPGTGGFRFFLEASLSLTCLTFLHLKSGELTHAVGASQAQWLISDSSPSLSSPKKCPSFLKILYCIYISWSLFYQMFTSMKGLNCVCLA